MLLLLLNDAAPPAPAAAASAATTTTTTTATLTSSKKRNFEPITANNMNWTVTDLKTGLSIKPIPYYSTYSTKTPVELFEQFFCDDVQQTETW